VGTEGELLKRGLVEARRVTICGPRRPIPRKLATGVGAEPGPEWFRVVAVGGFA
jgi:hypothetical protein